MRPVHRMRSFVVGVLLVLAVGRADARATDTWLEFGPYPWGVRLHEGTVEIQGETYSHLLEVWYPAQLEGEDVPAALDGAPFPVVFFEHAGGSFYRWYSFQFSRLASHGIIVISIAHDHVPCPGEFWSCHGALYQRTVDLVMDEWNASQGHFLYQRVDAERLALAGHSHGAAFVAMRDYRPMNPGGVYEVDSVSLLAPCPDVPIEDYLTTYEGMPPLQVIYGSRDTDPCVAHGQAIGVYEPGGRHGHYAYVVGADHYAFTDAGPLGQSTITRDEAQRASAASMVAFHVLMLNGDESALRALRGGEPLVTGGPEVRYQFHDQDHLTIDAFEDDDGPGEPGVAIAGIPGQTYINGFLSDTFVDFEAGVALVQEEIRSLVPDGPQCATVLFYEDNALADDVYGEAIDREVAAGRLCTAVTTTTQTTFATLIGAHSWDLIVSANQDGSRDATHPFDAPLRDYLCNGGVAIVSDFRVDSTTAEAMLACGGARFDGTINWAEMTSTGSLFAGMLDLANPGWGIWTYGLDPGPDAHVYATNELTSSEHDPTRNAFGLPVIQSGMLTFEEQFALDPARTLHHPTWALELAWSAPGATMTQALAAQPDDPFDATRWLTLSFRILQLHGDPLNAFGETKDLHVTMTDRDGDTSSIALSDAPQGPLRYPVPPSTVADWKSVFETYRFPLGQFAEANPALDLDRLDSVGLVCDVTTTGRLLLDDLEFAGRARSGDVDGDGDVDTVDLVLLLSAWGECPDPPEGCPADFDGDGRVGFSDVLILLSAWGNW